MERRKFIRNGILTGLSLTALNQIESVAFPNTNTSAFKLKYAPHFGMFKNHAPSGVEDELQFMADQGFKALEDNGMKGRPIPEQEKIAKKMTALNMEMGVFVATASFTDVTFAGNDKNVHNVVLDDIRASVEVAQRCNAKWITVVPGKFDSRLDWDYQTANCIELLKQCAGILEPHGLVMVLEPLNRQVNHPGLFLTEISQAYMICKAVNSPSCKILDDLYHQQITEGNLMMNLDKAWSEIEYFQVGDNPGRNEPTTGEINYKNIFKHLHGRGYTGIVGMEHGNSKTGKDGELALLKAYQECDSF
jgi:hydroxypyruvate isomerase